MKRYCLFPLMLLASACSTVAPITGGETVRALWAAQIQGGAAQKDVLDAATARAAITSYHKAAAQPDMHAQSQAMIVGLSK
ncbi:hypothetical protein [Massilia sp. TS11]|uniref:hypothetical protein n=1 Tax=Massilia sp. TS11 TaxID=2908003 RepID=UPI001EDBE67F|nr:hypothetical protein [Massilia sp. TS11]MCG2585809.1 hypothetical protein [Massilia sp. TS11]